MGEATEAVPLSGTRTEFRSGDDATPPLASIPGLVGTDIADGATVISDGQEYKVTKTRFVLEPATKGSPAFVFQKVSLKKTEKPWYIRLPETWQRVIGVVLAVLVVFPFIYYFALIPLLSGILSHQLEANGLAVLADADHTIVRLDEIAGRPTIEAAKAFDIEYRILAKAVLARYFVPLVPWLLFLCGCLLPLLLIKRLGGEYYRENGVLEYFLVTLGLAVGFGAVGYWNGFSAPPVPPVKWPRDYAGYADELWSRGATIWPILTAWFIPAGVILMKAFGLDTVGQLVEKFIGAKKQKGEPAGE